MVKRNKKRKPLVIVAITGKKINGKRQGGLANKIRLASQWNHLTRDSIYKTGTAFLSPDLIFKQSTS